MKDSPWGKFNYFDVEVDASNAAVSTSIYIIAAQMGFKKGVVRTL
jgi:hypothetical protein